GHGTAISGVLAAIDNNGVGVTGLNWKVQLMPIKQFTDAGTFELGDPAAGGYYAVNNRAQVINCSCGFYADQLPPSEIADERAAVAYAASRNILIVNSAANDGSDNDIRPVVPDFGLPNVIVVAATDKADHLAPFSNFGAISVDLGAPGRDIWTTYPVA